MSKSGADFHDFGSSVRSFLEGFLNLGGREGTGAEAKIADFPGAGIDGFLSHFVFTIQINKGQNSGRLFSYTWPVAIQTVARSNPFIYKGSAANHHVEFPLPTNSQLPRVVSENDFPTKPPGFFEEGKETIFLQILNLDAWGDTPQGKMRCILGETFRREYPDIFNPSFGAAQSLGRTGLPAKLFFAPTGIFETPFGALHVRPQKNLLAARVTSIPPVGGSPTLLGPIPLDSVEEVRANKGALPQVPAATLLALAHPIDAAVLGENVFQQVEQSIAVGH